MGQIEAAAMHIPVRDNIPNAAQRAAARLVLADRALRHPDPESWLAEMLDVLDLRGDRSDG